MLWEKSTPVILYGAAYSGKLVSESFAKKINIVAFLDKRADEIKTVNNIPVYLPQKTPFNEEQKKNFIVIICVKNVFDHKNIAKKMLTAGFLHIITFEQQEIFQMIDKKCLKLPIEVKPYRVNLRFIWNDMAVIKKNNRRIIARIPVPLIFTNFENDKWGNWPIQALYPHINLFSFYNGLVECQVNEYIDDYCMDGAKKIGNICTSQRWKQNILESRQSVFHNMDQHWQLKDSFFYDNAPTAEFHDGKFNLTAGKHRAVFLVVKGESFIPLSIAENEYIRFLNMDKAKLVMNYLEKIGIEETFFPILHPYFYTFSSYTGFSLYFIIKYLMSYLGKAFFSRNKKVSDLNIYSATRKYSVIARYFMQIGSNVQCCDYRDPLDLLLDDMAGITVKNSSQISSVYDIAIIEMGAESNQNKVIDIESKSYLLIVKDGYDFKSCLPFKMGRWEIVYQFFYGDDNYQFIFIEKIINKEECL